MRRILISLLASACVAAIMAGCSKDNGNDDNEPKDYFPLAVNNSWTFHVEADSAGHDTTYTETQTIVRTTTWHDSTWYVMFTTSDTTLDSSYYRKDRFFLRMVYFMAGNALEVLASPLDPVSITSWEDSTILVIVPVFIQGEVEAFETITVDAGTFDCYREKLEISGAGLNYEIRNWLADGVGPVRIVSVSGDDSTDMQLQSYSLH